MIIRRKLPGWFRTAAAERRPSPSLPSASSLGPVLNQQAVLGSSTFRCRPVDRYDDASPPTILNVKTPRDIEQQQYGNLKQKGPATTWQLGPAGWARHLSQSAAAAAAPAGGDEASASQIKLVASVILERLPVILPESPEWAQDYENFSFDWRQRYVRKEFPKEFLDAASSTAEEEDSGVGSDEFEAAPRRTAADEANDVRSLQRALDRRLYLIVKGPSGLAQSGDDIWHFPEKVYSDENSMRQCAEGALQAQIGTSLETYFVGNAPCAHHSVNGVERTVRFYFKSQVLSGKLSFASQEVKDYAWVSKEEIFGYLKLDENDSRLFQALLV